MSDFVSVSYVAKAFEVSPSAVYKSIRLRGEFRGLKPDKAGSRYHGGPRFLRKEVNAIVMAARAARGRREV